MIIGSRLTARRNRPRGWSRQDQEARKLFELLASIIATLVASGGPLLIVEVLTKTSGSQDGTIGVAQPAAHTLTLNWADATQRWIGVGSQIAVGVLGMVLCARLLAGEARR